MSSMRLRTFLLAVVTLALVPLLGVAAIAIWWAHQDELRRSLWLLSGGAVGAFALSLSLAHIAGRQFAGRLRRLRTAFEAFGRGETVPELPELRLAELSGLGARIHADRTSRSRGPARSARSP
jgi:hypothetical protein